MRAVVQRVSRASVTVAGETIATIGRGLLVLVGIAAGDSDADSEYLLDKVINLRIFEDESDKMDLSLADVEGGLLIVSQFTLYGDTRRGRRPSFIKAAPPADAKRLYERFIEKAAERVPDVQTGRFQAMMDVELVNDGPVTIILDSEKTI